MPNSYFPRLFSPIKLGSVELRNRICFSPNCPTLVNNPLTGVFTENAAYHYEERAKGGVGLIVVGAIFVDKSANYYAGPMPQLYDDSAIEPLRRIIGRCENHDVPVFIQLFHSGKGGSPLFRYDPLFDYNAPLYAMGPSQIPTGVGRVGNTRVQVPREMDELEIELILNRYVEAAERGKRAGARGVEFYPGLEWHFFTSTFNRRTDRWGGSLENRARFMVEILNRIRSKVGKDFVLGARIPVLAGDDFDRVHGGTNEDSLSAIKYLDEKTSIDYFNTIPSGRVDRTIAPMYVKSGYTGPYTAEFKKVTTKPIFVIGRINDPVVAEMLLEKGAGDVVSMARQLIADPEFANKAREGRQEDIRSCVGVNFCWSFFSKGLRIQCIQNPAVGREKIWGEGTLKQAESRKKVLIIGGGPAGLEMARVCALRGHDVVLYEKEKEVGGHVNLESLLPGRAEVRNIVLWLERQAQKAGATFVTKAEITDHNFGEIVMQEKPEVIVVATGSKLPRNGLQGYSFEEIKGWQSPDVYTYEEVLRNKIVVDNNTYSVAPDLKGNVLIFDSVGDVMACGLAEILAEKAANVEVATWWRFAGWDLDTDWTLDYAYEKLMKLGVKLTPHVFIKEIRDGEVLMENVHSGQESLQNVSSVILVTPRLSENHLAVTARQFVGAVHIIGDALSPRGVYTAIFEAQRLGRQI